MSTATATAPSAIGANVAADGPANTDAAVLANANTSGQSHAYSIRPNAEQKFKVPVVQKILSETMTQHLTGIRYNADQCSQLTRTIVDEVKAKLKELNLPRYKFVVTAVLGELKGEGVRMGARCFWDQDTDNVAKEEFRNESLFCMVAAFAAFYY